MAIKRNALGRGLDSLIRMDDVQPGGSSAINEVALNVITPNPDQPRQIFDEEALVQLADSIRELGIIQPLTLRESGNGKYQIISGERRYRAAKLAGLATVPAYIRSAGDCETTEMALIENIQRQDLNPIEIALTLRKLTDQYSLTQERLSARIGKPRATVANYLRLLRLPADVQLGLKEGAIDMGHARAILSVDSAQMQLALFKETVKQNLSVRQVEELSKQMNENGEEEIKKKRRERRDQADAYKSLAQLLSKSFGTNVTLKCTNSGNGKITIPFKDENELERLMAMFDRLKNLE